MIIYHEFREGQDEYGSSDSRVVVVELKPLQET